MAWLEEDATTGIYRVGFRFGGTKLKKSLRTRDRRKAEAALGTLESTIEAVEKGWQQVPPNSDVTDFLLSGGRRVGNQADQQRLTLGKLFQQYFASLPQNSLEERTLYEMKLHEALLNKHFTEAFEVQSLSLADLQKFVDRRSADKGTYGRKVCATTIKKPIVTLRTLWNWGVRNKLLVGKFPHTGVRYPKSTEKPIFQTMSEVESRLAKGGYSSAEERDLWDSVFLTVTEIGELLEFVKERARHPFIFPMLVFAAHTGARRSEIIRSRITDFDFERNFVTIHERKRSHTTRTTRRVPISPVLQTHLKEWLGIHPGGPLTFYKLMRDGKSPGQSGGVPGLTCHQMHNHFKRTLARSRWKHLRGWHVFRHSFCSNCAAKGVDQRVINGWVGHQTDDMVRRYRHLLPNQQHEALKQVFG